MNLSRFILREATVTDSMRLLSQALTVLVRWTIGLVSIL